MRALVAALVLCSGVARAERFSDTEIEKYCTARSQARAADEREVPAQACRVVLRSALEALEAHELEKGAGLMRAIDDLMTTRRVEPAPPACICGSCPEAVVKACPPPSASDCQPRVDAALRKADAARERAASRKAAPAFNPFDSPRPQTVRPPARPAPAVTKKASGGRDLMDPFQQSKPAPGVVPF